MDTGFPDELALDRFEKASIELDRAQIEAHVKVAFEEIFQRYQTMVYNLTYRILGDREEALDVCQEVFLAVFRKLDRFRGESSLKTWIYRIAINRASNRCRWWNRLRRRGTVSLDEHLCEDDNRTFSDTLESTGHSPETSVLMQEKRQEIEHALQRLPMSQRIVVIMRDVEGLSYEEISGLLQVSLGTIKSRIARGREELKRRLNGTLG